MSPEVINLLKRLIKEAKKWAEKSEGDMLKSVYDPDADGKVNIADDSDKLEGSSKTEVQNHTPKAHTLGSHSTKGHAELTGVTASQHHSKTTSLTDIAPWDSGFISIANGNTGNFNHNLNTKDLLCQIFVRTPASAYHTLWGSANCNSDAWTLNNNTIQIYNNWGVTKEFRLLLWKF